MTASRSLTATFACAVLAMAISGGCDRQDGKQPAHAPVKTGQQPVRDSAAEGKKIAAAPGPSVWPQTAQPAALSAPQQMVLAKMQGTWRSTQDRNSSLKITGSTVHMIYRSPGIDSDDPFQIVFVPTCDPDLAAPEKPAFRFKNDTLDLCYILKEASAAKLSYIYAGRGNTLSFRKVR